MSSIVEICNIGLQALGVDRMAAYPETTTKNGREMSFAYEPTKLETLRRHNWSFARKQVQLSADSTAPLFDFAHYFTLPADCVRILPPADHSLDWRVEGRKIATDWAAPLDLLYIRDVVDPNEMDSIFRQVLGLNLALKTCKRLTGSNQLKAEINAELKDLLAEARRVNAIENTSDEMPEDTWITVRSGSVTNVPRA